MIFCLSYFWKSSRNVDLVQAVPFYAFKPVAAADFAGKFYYQFVYGFTCRRFRRSQPCRARIFLCVLLRKIHCGGAYSAYTRVLFSSVLFGRHARTTFAFYLLRYLLGLVLVPGFVPIWLFRCCSFFPFGLGRPPRPICLPRHLPVHFCQICLKELWKFEILACDWIC